MNAAFTIKRTYRNMGSTGPAFSKRIRAGQVSEVKALSREEFDRGWDFND